MKEDLKDMDCMSIITSANTSNMPADEQKALAEKYKQCLEEVKELEEETEKVCNKPDGQEPEVRPLEPSENTFINTLHTSVTKLVVKVNKMKKEVNKLIVKRTTATKTDKVNITRKINKLVVNIHKIHKKISVIKNTIHQVKFVSYKPTVIKNVVVKYHKKVTTLKKKITHINKV